MADDENGATTIASHSNNDNGPQGQPANDQNNNTNNNNNTTTTSNRTNTVLNLNAIVRATPLEEEAETFLLQAIEHRDPTKPRGRRRQLHDKDNNNNNNDDDDTGLLEHIPPGSEAVFSVIPEHEQLDCNDDDNDDDDKDDLPQESLRLDDSHTIRTARSGITLLSSERLDHDASSSSSLSLSLDNMPMKSVEETLFGLTTALSAMQQIAQNNDNGVPSNNNHNNNNNNNNNNNTSNNNRHHRRKPTLEELLNDNGKKNDDDDDDVDATASATDVVANIHLIHRRAGKHTKNSTQQVIVDADGQSVRLATTTLPHPHSLQQQQQQDNLSILAELGEGTSVRFDTTNDGSSMPTNNSQQQQQQQQSLSSSPITLTAPHGRQQPWHGMSATPILKYLQERTIVIQDVRTFWGQRSKSIVVRAQAILLYFVLPLVATAFLLFYVGKNPPTGRIDVTASENNTLIINTDGNAVNSHKASASWWLLFITRQSFVLGLAKATEIFLIDFLCLGVKWASFLLGPFLTLFLVQSRGWPFLATTWSIYAILLLHGDSRFSRHWLYFQDALDIFNETNPSGNFVNDKGYYRVLLIVICVGPIVTLKRLYLGLFLGRKSFATYAEDLARVMRKVLLVTQIASLSRYNDFAEAGRMSLIDQDQLQSILERAGDRENTSSRTNDTKRSKRILAQPSVPLLLNPANRDKATGGLTKAQKAKIAELLGDWEEPVADNSASLGKISIRSILQFRQSVTFLNASYLFGVAFGLASTRGRCIESAQQVYKKLVPSGSAQRVLNFETIAQLALRSDGSLDQEKLRTLIRLFRPDREGSLSMLDFVKSVDAVYKEARLLRASIRNSKRLDKAFEGIVSVLFYILMAAVILAVVGIDPLALFLALSPVILAFTFMIGSSSAKFFEGILFILIRKPYEIGDRINISSPSSESSASGSPGWVVADISLYHTTVVYGTTNERATIPNGSLAGARVLNMARSPRAVLYVNVRFGVEVPADKIGIFEEAVRKFIVARPREWLKLIGFRMAKFEADLGFQEYVIILQHRESWQNIGALLSSKAQVSAFCLELSKKMDMRYKSPTLPVDLAVVDKNSNFGNFGLTDENAHISSRFGESDEDQGHIKDRAALFADKKNE